MKTDQVVEKPKTTKKGTPEILVVDDDDRIRSLLLDTLSALGYHALGAKDGEEALLLLETEKLDLVIADVRMPKMNGLSLLKAIKGKNPLMPVLIITGYNFTYTKDQALESGADGFLAKPFRIGKIEELMRKALGIKGTTGDKSYRLKKILVVDDDDQLRDMLLEVLGSLDYFPIGVKDGEEALNQLKIQDFDLVVSDIRMPKMDGLALLKNIKAKAPQLPVVMITGFPSICPAQKVIQEGADGYLAKPFRIEKIDELMRDLLSGGEREHPSS
jgi:DNA-binding NtrC family response regulator